MELKIIDGMFETKAVNSDRRSVDAVMSTGIVDRYHEIVEAKSWVKRLSRFKSSPVLLKDHDHTQPIGHWENVRVTDEGLVGTAVFASTDAAQERFALHRDGHVKAFSVGFIPHSWSYKEVDHEGKKMKVRVFDDCELLECSSVAVPANPDALQRLIKGCGDAAELPAPMKKVIGDIVADQIKQLTDPDGPMARLFDESLQRALDREELAGYFAPARGIAGEKSGGTSGGDGGDELKHELRKLVGG